MSNFFDVLFLETWNRKHLFLCMLFFSLAIVDVRGQDPIVQKEKLAYSFYSSGSYEKAKELYGELLDANPSHLGYYDHYLNCLIKMEDWKEAKKFTSKKVKQFPQQAQVQVDHGWVLKQVGDQKKSEQWFIELEQNSYFINIQQVSALSAALQKRQMYERAANVLMQVRKQSGNPRLYTIELAEIYATMGNYASVFGEYLYYLETQSHQYEQIKQRLAVYMTQADLYEDLKKELVSKLQKFPSNTAFQELLFWTFVQQKDWNGAFIQMRSLDAKMGNTGGRVRDLAVVCLENEAYSVAIMCYEYIITKGQPSPFYNEAQAGLLQTRLIKIEKGGGDSQEELFKLESDYLRFIEERGYLPGAEKAKLGLAKLYIHFLNQIPKAIATLESYMKSTREGTPERGEAKLQLAEAYLIDGQDWEAHLLYKQVEKEFKDEPLGQEARFRYATLCYYRGEFEWALTQLEVLKGATTQLISNNAIELALHIIESTGLDSSDDALVHYAKAELMVKQNKWMEADSILMVLKNTYTYHELQDNALYLKAKIAEKKGEISQAIAYYEKIVSHYYYGLLADDALIILGRLYEFRLNQPEKAIPYYEKLLFEFTSSFHAYEARNRYKALKERFPGA